MAEGKWTALTQEKGAARTLISLREHNGRVLLVIGANESANFSIFLSPFSCEGEKVHYCANSITERKEREKQKKERVRER